MEHYAGIDVHCGRDGQNRCRSEGDAQHSQREGALHRWSGRPLLRSPEALQAYVRDARTVWLIRDVRRQERFPQLPDLDEAFGPQLRAAERVHLSEDGRIEVLRVERAPLESSGAS